MLPLEEMEALDAGGRSKDERAEEGVEKEETELPSDELKEKVDSAEEERELGRELGITREGREERDTHDEEEENADDVGGTTGNWSKIGVIQVGSERSLSIMPKMAFSSSSTMLCASVLRLRLPSPYRTLGFSCQMM